MIVLSRREAEGQRDHIDQETRNIMSNSIFANKRAVLLGVVAGVAFFAAAQGFFILRGPQYAESQDGSVMVRPIVKDDSTRNMTMSVIVGLVGGIYVARALHRRSSKT
ncbi:hypothetical protein M8997_019275 [Phyllobacterium sp. 21LDTY02-6]|uniref:hypothetical protein n=1 Tax=Phyllobacterium sp. 21LDTY02-6 TaxID=2944903 RepID=UPI002020F5BC|nr:hypothetical protein [Phyllobacterium sp. 21LDTY02-6]MCO4319334.1 hypothetical protein [Phyllobacterium sp. 21LDTY02-6]